eukprot:scaffold137401_cov31-Tisochrysis_lutea.AAC.3
MSLSRSTAACWPSSSGRRNSDCATMTLKRRIARRRACDSVLAEEMSEPRSKRPANELSFLSSACAFPPARRGSLGRAAGGESNAPVVPAGSGGLTVFLK